MIATAIRLQEITKEAVFDEMILTMATDIHRNRNVMSDDEFMEAIYRYSGLLASLTTTLATSVLLTESQLDDMVSEIKEFDQLGKDITNGND